MRSSRDPSVRSRGWPAALALALALPLAGCGPEAGRPAASSSASSPYAGTTATPGTRERLRVDGRTREYLLHRPAPAPATGRPKPLVIAFHGRGANAAHLREQSRLERAAGARGMLVAFPEGLGEGWGAGTRATEQRPDPGLDVRFTEALIAHLVRTEGADPERVYVTGFSNGGSMALRVAAERPGLVAGAASVSGQLPAGPARVRPTGAVPVLVVYGADDPVRPLGGWPSPPPGPGEPVLPTLSARASAEAFAAAGGAEAPVTKAGRGRDRTVWRLKDPSDPAATVELVVVHDAGHTWPGSAMTPPEGFGRTSTALDATDAVLDFFAGA
ncbi:PHB depolymerase family esterase [Streptomyces sp. NPDC052309]|uniref:alpha/beta hydrolase family esterase n=1 Tax=Streptomyces sp. NPDC052309 TaxID=3155421 RepID=UPI003412CE20